MSSERLSLLRHPVVVSAVIVASALILVLLVWEYRSPFNQCVRALEAVAGRNNPQLDAVMRRGYAMQFCTQKMTAREP